VPGGMMLAPPAAPGTRVASLGDGLEYVPSAAPQGFLVATPAPDPCHRPCAMLTKGFFDPVRIASLEGFEGILAAPSTGVVRMVSVC